MQSTHDLREIRARMDCGLATANDTRVLFSFLDHLVWRTEKEIGQEVKSCRHCGILRGGAHASGCPAALVP